jgi:hypothetical protein
MSYSQVPDTPVFNSLVAMTAASISQCDLDDREMMIARISALAAVGASPLSYALNAAAAAETSLTLEDAQGILVAVSPIIGTARTASAAVAITEGIGLALALAEAAADE